MLATKYLNHALELLQRLQETQLKNIEKAAEMIAQACAEGHTFYAWGGPHSSLPVQDIFERAGGLAIVNAVIAPGLSYEVAPIRVGMFLERVEGYGHFFFSKVGAEPGDVILLVSTSGRNPFPIEMAMSAKEAGLKVIGMTSMAYTNAVSSRHSSGTKMHEHCDIVLDNLTEPGDASIADERLPQKVGPTSGWMGCLILQTLMVEVAERLAERGITPPVRFAGNIDGQEEYRRSLFELIDKRSTKFGGIYSPRRKM
jgi:uncharacterized phosphosugar-binding protein